MSQHARLEASRDGRRPGGGVAAFEAVRENAEFHLGNSGRAAGDPDCMASRATVDSDGATRDVETSEERYLGGNVPSVASTRDGCGGGVEPPQLRLRGEFGRCAFVPDAVSVEST